MKKRIFNFSIFIILALLLAACQTATAATATSAAGRSSPARQTARAANGGGTNTGAGGGGGPAGTSVSGTGASTFRRFTAATPTPLVFPTRKPTTTTAPTAQSSTAGAETSAQAYFAALEKKDFSGAAHWVSDFSLTMNEMTASDVATQLGAQSVKGASWSDLQVLGSQQFSDNTILVHVSYRTAPAAAVTPTATPTPGKSTAGTPAGPQDNPQKDELWPFRLESGKWMYNWGNIIDYHTLDVAEQTMGGITVKPTQLVRFSDRIELHAMMQNRISEGMYFGQPNETLALFHFGDQVVPAEQNRIILAGIHTYFDEVITVKGLFTIYPNQVEIRKWKSLQVPPWYTFQF